MKQPWYGPAVALANVKEHVGGLVQLVGLVQRTLEPMVVGTSKGPLVRRTVVKIADETLDNLEITLWGPLAYVELSADDIVCFNNIGVKQYRGRIEAVSQQYSTVIVLAQRNDFTSAAGLERVIAACPSAIRSRFKANLAWVTRSNPHLFPPASNIPDISDPSDPWQIDSRKAGAAEDNCRTAGRAGVWTSWTPGMTDPALRPPGEEHQENSVEAKAPLKENAAVTVPMAEMLQERRGTGGEASSSGTDFRTDAKKQRVEEIARDEKGWLCEMGRDVNEGNGNGEKGGAGAVRHRWFGPLVELAHVGDHVGGLVQVVAFVQQAFPSQVQGINGRGNGARVMKMKLGDSTRGYVDGTLWGSFSYVEICVGDIVCLHNMGVKEYKGRHEIITQQYSAVVLLAKCAEVLSLKELEARTLACTSGPAVKERLGSVARWALTDQRLLLENASNLSPACLPAVTASCPLPDQNLRHTGHVSNDTAGEVAGPQPIVQLKRLADLQRLSSPGRVEFWAKVSAIEVNLPSPFARANLTEGVPLRTDDEAATSAVRHSSLSGDGAARWRVDAAGWRKVQGPGHATSAASGPATCNERKWTTEDQDERPASIDLLTFLICHGCLACGRPLFPDHNRVYQSCPCHGSARRGPAPLSGIGWIYAPFTLEVWDETAHAHVQVENGVAQQIFSGIPAALIVASQTQHFEKTKPPNDQFQLCTLGTQGEDAKTGCTLGELPLSLLQIVQKGGPLDAKREGVIGDRLSEFDVAGFVLILLRMLFHRANSPFKFQASCRGHVGTGAGDEQGRLHLTMFKPCRPPTSDLGQSNASKDS